MILLILVILLCILFLLFNNYDHFNNNLKIISKNYDHYIKNDIEVEVDLLTKNNYNFHIVYFINCIVNPNYFDWLINQINIVNNFNKKIFIIATIEEKNEDLFKKKTLELYPDVIIECYYENEFEYRGILKVWELGQKYNSRNDIILYLHSKGVTHYTNYSFNSNDNYNIILKDKNKIEEIFSIFPKVDKIGYSSSSYGSIWYNFWFVRSSYIFNIEKPVKTNRRHYYEEWLGKIVDNDDEKNPIEERTNYNYRNTLDSCYGFYTDKNNIGNIGSYYDADNQIFI